MIIFTGYVILSFFFKILGKVTVKYFFSIFGKVFVIACLKDNFNINQLIGPTQIIKNHLVRNPIKRNRFLKKNLVIGLFISKYILLIDLKALLINSSDLLYIDIITLKSNKKYKKIEARNFVPRKNLTNIEL